MGLRETCQTKYIQFFILDKLTILLVGSGGREHAIAWRLSLSDKVNHIYVAPGNKIKYKVVMFKKRKRNNNSINNNEPYIYI